MQAFDIDFQERIRLDIDNPENAASYALIDTFLLPYIVRTSPSWYADNLRTNGHPSWVDHYRVNVAQIPELKEPNVAIPISGISADNWKKLSPEQKVRLHQLENSNRLYWQHLLMIAQLSEELQRSLLEVTTCSLTDRYNTPAE